MNERMDGTTLTRDHVLGLIVGGGGSIPAPCNIRSNASSCASSMEPDMSEFIMPVIMPPATSSPNARVVKCTQVELVRPMTLESRAVSNS